LGVVDWYYIADKRQLGPVTFEALEELADTGKLQAADLVWHEGMTTWERAGAQGLCAAAQVEHAANARPLDRTNHDPRQRQPRHDGMPVGAKVGLLVGLGVLLLIVIGLSLYQFMRADGGHEIAADGNLIHGFLDDDAPLDAVTGDHYRIHTVRFVRGRTYHIDLQADRPGPPGYMVRLENSAMVQLAQAGNAKEGGRAHIDFRCPRSDSYRIIVTTSLPGARPRRVGLPSHYTLFVREP
jgi:hypothetical protein